MNTGNNKYSYPEKWVSILLKSMLVVLLTGWLVAQLFGDKFYVWVIDNFETYQFERVFLVFFVLIDFWLIFFSIWLVLLGYKSILSNKMPPDNYFLLFKVRNESGKKAKYSGAISIIFGFLSFIFFCVMVYVSYITHSGSI